MSQAPRCKHGEPERGVHCDKCCLDRALKLEMPDNVEYEIEFSAMENHTFRHFWARDDYRYRDKADAEWMARYLELVKGKGRTRVVQVKRKAL